MQDEFFETLDDMGADVDKTLKRLMGDRKFYLDYLMQLPANENIVALRKAVEAKDYTAAEHEVHTLKGVALNLGLLPLVDVCMDMLLDLRAGLTDDIDEELAAIEENFAEWVQVIETKRGAE